jgi:AcrR family transcriptional regulator
MRCDDETKCLIVEAANSHFLRLGYALANLNAIAADAGVSTKTIYRLFPAKSDLLASVITSRIDRFFLAVDEASLKSLSPLDGLIRLLSAYGKLALSAETTAITRLIIGESERFPEIAAAFYERAIKPTNAVIEKWLSDQAKAGTITADRPKEISGMLRGMMVMEPQRAAMLGQEPLPSIPDIEQRAILCADVFLKSNGACGAENRKPAPA